MILSRFALLSLIICASAQAFFSQSEPTRAARTWEVRKFEIDAALPQSESDRYLTAVASLEIRNTSPASASGITLRISPAAEISSVKINGQTSDFSKGEEKIGSGSLQRIIARGLSVPSGTDVRVEVSYKLKVEENSGLAAISPQSAQFLPLSFWYPAPTSWFFTRGVDYAPMSVRISGAAGRKVVAPGRSVASGFSEDALSVQPFFLSGSWEALESSGTEVLVPSGSGAAERERAREVSLFASEARSYFTRLLGELPDGQLRLVAVRRGGGFSSGRTILLDQSVFNRPALDSQTAVVIADAVAKIWLGSLAQVSGDGYSAIREGLSRYLATQFIEQKFGKEVADVERLRQRLAYGTIAKRDGALTQISPLDDFYATSMTNKGAIVWRQLVRDIGSDRFFGALRSIIRTGRLELSSIRQAFPEQKVFMDYAFDQVTDGNILIGLPRVDGSETTIALRNTGPIDVTVAVKAVTESGEVLMTDAVVPSKSFGEASFKTSSEIALAEVDPEKYFLQQDYSDDVAPRRFIQSDLVLLVKSAFDRQDYAAAEKDAREILVSLPRFDDVRTLLARSLLAEGKTSDAEREFKALLAEKLPTSRTIAWANVGLGEIAMKAGKNADALGYFNVALRTDAELGATFAARRGRNQTGLSSQMDQTVKEFFSAFDKALQSNRKSDIDAMIVPGEMVKFSKGVAGQTQEWTTTVRHVDMFGSDVALVEVELSLRLLNRNAESGQVVYRMNRANGVWKLSGIETFEVR